MFQMNCSIFMNFCIEKEGKYEKNNNTSYAVMISGKMNEQNISIFNITQNDLHEKKGKKQLTNGFDNGGGDDEML